MTNVYCGFIACDDAVQRKFAAAATAIILVVDTIVLVKINNLSVFNMIKAPSTNKARMFYLFVKEQHRRDVSSFVVLIQIVLLSF